MSTVVLGSPHTLSFDSRNNSVKQENSSFCRRKNKPREIRATQTLKSPDSSQNQARWFQNQHWLRLTKPCFPDFALIQLVPTLRPSSSGTPRNSRGSSIITICFYFVSTNIVAGYCPWCLKRVRHNQATNTHTSQSGSEIVLSSPQGDKRLWRHSQ